MPFWNKKADQTIKVHATDSLGFQSNGELDRKDTLAHNEHSDQLPSLQTNLLRKVEYSDANTRWLHTKANSYANQHTFGLIDEMFWHQPFPFKYIALDEEDVIKAKALTSMNHVHSKWMEANMFAHFKDVQANGLGVGTGWIVRVDVDKYVIFNECHIDGEHIWVNNKTNEVEEVWFSWKREYFTSVGKHGGNTDKQNHKDDHVIVKAIIGVNAVPFTPSPDPDCTLGRSDLLRIWTTLTYREANHYYGTIYNKKGGINGRSIIAPDSMINSTSKRVFKKEALKGLESELIEIYYPKALVDAKIDPMKVVQWTENKGGNPNFPAVDDMLATDSPLPPSFTQGPASGALGGVAPQEDADRINRFLQSYCAKVQKLVHDINTVFFGIQAKNYMIVPYFREKKDPMQMGGSPLKTDDPKQDEPKPKTEDDPAKTDSNSRSHRIEFKRTEGRSNAQGVKSIQYEGNMLSSGYYEYEEMNWMTGQTKKVYEHLDAQELKAFIDNPMSVKEFYLDLEHAQHTEVFSGNSLGKVAINGYTTDNGVVKDKAILSFKEEYDPKHASIFLSPIYVVQLKDNGKKYKGEKALSQVNISIINCSLCSYPRSALTGLDTSAKRSE